MIDYLGVLQISLMSLKHYYLYRFIFLEQHFKASTATASNVELSKKINEVLLSSYKLSNIHL